MSDTIINEDTELAEIDDANAYGIDERGPHPESPDRNNSRRKLLGALAASAVGAVATACESSGLTASAAGSSTSLSTPVPPTLAHTGGKTSAAANVGGNGSTSTSASISGSASGPARGSRSSTVPTSRNASAAIADQVPSQAETAGGQASNLPVSADDDSRSTTRAQPGPGQPYQLFDPPAYVGSDANIVHVANRLTFGITPAVRRQIETDGPKAFIQDQLSKDRPHRGTEDMLKPFKLLKSGKRIRPNNVRRNQIGFEVTHSNVLRAVYSRNQLYEMMAHLWMDHFNISDLPAQHAMAIIDYQENVIRPHAMGKFRDLLTATAHSWGMLIFLNNFESNAYSESGVNENYGRELLELHSLGIHPDGSQVYTEADIRAASLVMSGWSVEVRTKRKNFGDFRFRDEFHYKEDVSLLDGQWTTAGLSGKARGDSLLKFLASHESTARYIAYKLARRFVSDDPPQSIIDSMARVYQNNDTAIVPMLNHLFNSSEFRESKGQKLRRPFEYMVASMRALGVKPSGRPSTSASVALKGQLGNQGQDPWSWPQPNGFSENAVDWLTTDSMMSRWTMVADLALGIEAKKIKKRPEIKPEALKADIESIRPGAKTVDELISRLAAQVGVGSIAMAHRSGIASAAGFSPGDAASAVTGDQLATVAALVLSHPNFQIR